MSYEINEQMIRDRLCVSINWVEGVACKWRRNEPFVMRLVQALVKERMMEYAVNPIYEIIREYQEAGE